MTSRLCAIAERLYRARRYLAERADISPYRSVYSTGEMKAVELLAIAEYTLRREDYKRESRSLDERSGQDAG
jgi:hypothetical protein